ncbi:MAG: YigZ family protein [Firmicutes bacterium]|nr:YigZ family protein [Bacillota bacterium]
MTTFLIPGEYGEAELVEKRSRFIGRVWHVETEETALARLRETREKHCGASHNVYAYILRENNIMRYSDDGEPGGTAGQPILNVLRAEGVRDVCCVVTRYFGGILLGAGGLMRAYSAAAKLALAAAGILTMAPWRRLRLNCTYAQYEKIRRPLEERGGRIETTDFGAAVALDVLLREDAADDTVAALTELTAGNIGIETLGSVFRGV